MYCQPPLIQDHSRTFSVPEVGKPVTVREVCVPPLLKMLYEPAPVLPTWSQ